MNSHWLLETHGNPLGKVHDFIELLWDENNLDGMLVPVMGGNELHATPRYVTDIASISKINPFKPLMEKNIACLIPELLLAYPNAKIGTLLRPCEMRALTEMVKHHPFSVHNLLTISVDCLGTLPADEYQWRLERIEKNLPAEDATPVESSDELAHEALRFAHQGGIIQYRYRSACQVCVSPAAKSADINIHIIGLPVRQYLLVSSNEPHGGKKVHLDKLSDGVAEPVLVAQHERMVSKTCERHRRTMERVEEGLGGSLPVDVEALISQLEGCGNCGRCMDVCPICSVERPLRDPTGHFDRPSVMRWLISCAGCGMCEQACPNHLPIAAIFSHIRQLLAEPLDYVPGRSSSEPLPLV